MRSAVVDPTQLDRSTHRRRRTPSRRSWRGRWGWSWSWSRCWRSHSTCALAIASSNRRSRSNQIRSARNRIRINIRRRPHTRSRQPISITTNNMRSAVVDPTQLDRSTHRRRRTPSRRNGRRSWCWCGGRSWPGSALLIASPSIGKRSNQIRSARNRIRINKGRRPHTWGSQPISIAANHMIATRVVPGQLDGSADCGSGACSNSAHGARRKADGQQSSQDCENAQ